MKISVKVVPNSSKNKIEKTGDKKYKVWLKSMAKESKANKELIEYLSDCFKISKSQIFIDSGLKSKNKTLLITQ